MAKIVDDKLRTRFYNDLEKKKVTPMFHCTTCIKIYPNEPDSGKISDGLKAVHDHPEHFLCWAKQCTGTLSNEQDVRCKKVDDIHTWDEPMKQRIRMFDEMGTLMHVCASAKSTDDFDRCIIKEAKGHLSDIGRNKLIKKYKNNKS